MSADRQKRFRMPSSKLRDEANHAEPEVTSHRNAWNQARQSQSQAPIISSAAPTAGTNSTRSGNATVITEPVITSHRDAQTGHLNPGVAGPGPSAPTAVAGSKRKLNAVVASSEEDVERTNKAEGEYSLESWIVEL